ncbi:hypothetical protein BY458DRAFT_499291, partial [Sporodiniella umbellata]
MIYISVVLWFYHLALFKMNSRPKHLTLLFLNRSRGYRFFLCFSIVLITIYVYFGVNKQGVFRQVALVRKYSFDAYCASLRDMAKKKKKK